MTDVGDDRLLCGIADGERAFCGPEQLHIDLTNLCTLRCLCCWHRSTLIPSRDALAHWSPRFSLPFERVLQLVGEAADLGVKRIIYSGGGDPLCYPRLFDVLEATRSRGIEATVISNFTVCNEPMLRRLVSSDVSRLVVSLWAGEEETYLAMHPGMGRGVFERVVSLMKKLGDLRPLGARPMLIVVNVVCNKNVAGVEKMVAAAIEMGAGEIWFQPVDVESDRLLPLTMNQDQINGLIELLRGCKEKYVPLLKSGQENILNFDGFLEKLMNSRSAEGIFHSDVIDSIPCYMGWAECRVLANGDVVPCCKGDKFPLGNILEKRFDAIWFSPAYGEFRKRAMTLAKSDRYFAKINCAKVCDDWWLNKEIHARYREFVNRKQRAGGIGRAARKISDIFRFWKR
ncbi:MAG: radical SAM protein [Candidatus Aureabacteria bacterium]|nr:radical SAM protein [Candidatus Auribacterota bacterium]